MRLNFLRNILSHWNLLISERTYMAGHYPVWDEVKFVDWDPHLYSHRVKKAIHISLHPYLLTTSTGRVELRFLKHTCLWYDSIASSHYHNGLLRERFSSNTCNYQQCFGSKPMPPTMSEVLDSPITNNHVMVVQIVLLSESTYWLMKTCSTWTKSCDQYLCDNCETND